MILTDCKITLRNPRRKFKLDRNKLPVIIDRISNKLNQFLPEELIEVADDWGYELYAVGGCVRDPLLGKELGDIDLAIVGDAGKLADVVAQKLGSVEVITYQRFGTAVMNFPSFKLEMATSRAESYNSDSRKPSEVIPVEIDIDLRRRDFTINALAIGLNGVSKGRLLDLFNGLEDLQNGVIKTPLEPNITFSDDPLRMLRAIRFASELGFSIDNDTWDAIILNKDRLKIVSVERVGSEFQLMLSGADPVRAMKLLIDSGLMKHIIPEVLSMSGVEQVGRHHHKDVLIHSLNVMQNVVNNTKDPIVRLAGLLHDIGKPRTKHFDPNNGWTFHGHEVIGGKIAKRVGRRLSIGKSDLDKLVNLVRLHMRPINLTSEGVSDSAIRRMMVESGKHLQDQLILCKADITTANPRKVKQYLAAFDEMIERMAIVEKRDKLRNFQSPIRGEEIMSSCEIPPGALVGAIKEQIEEAILEGVIPNDPDAAREYLNQIKNDMLSLSEERIRDIRRKRDKKMKDRLLDYDIPDGTDGGE